MNDPIVIINTARAWRTLPGIVRRLACLVLIAAIAHLFVPAAVNAQSADPVIDAVARLAKATADVRAVESEADDATTMTQRGALNDRLAAARSTADETGKTLQAQIDLVDARIAEIGPPTPGVAEAPDIAGQRTSLARQRSVLDSAIRRGKLLTIEAQQISDEIAASQAAALGQQWATRNASPVSPAYWTAIADAIPRDLDRTMRLAADVTAGIARGMRDGRPWLALLGLVVAIGLAGPARIALRNAGRRYAIGSVPGHRVRRSGYAIWRLVTGTALPTLAAITLVQGIRWSGLASERAEFMLSALVWAIGIAAFVAALAGALLMRSQGSWRLLPIGDDVAAALLPWTWALAGFAALDPILIRFNTAIHASASATLAANTIEATARIVVVGGILVALGRLRAASRDAEDAKAEEAGDEQGVGRDGGAARAGVGIVTLVAWLVTLVSAGALLIGYVNFSLFLTGVVIVWLAVVVGTTYILMAAVDDLATTIFSSASRPGVVLARGIGIRASAIDQFGVLLSGVLRLALALLAVVMLLTPFGSGIGSSLDSFGKVAEGVSVGDVTISPGAIIRALVVLMVGLALARLFLRWLNERYLPTTEMDLSARNSLAMIARYITILLAVLWGLASLGIGMERIALLLSALSVGIGFGLQAITQNFVSGLILLAERPVKIGDLVRIGNDEGDVKRISVRSTEIELADHSTLIVPNSELITKSVLNKTLANPLGRVQIQFSVPLGVDPARIRAIVLETFAEQTSILDEPAPSVFLDSIVDGRILFNCFAHTSGPRAAYGARSAALMRVLERLAAEKIDVGTVSQPLQLMPAAGVDLNGR